MRKSDGATTRQINSALSWPNSHHNQCAVEKIEFLVPTECQKTEIRKMRVGIVVRA